VVWYGDLTFYGKPGEHFKGACGEVMPGDGLYAAMADPLASKLDASGAYPASWCGASTDWERRRPGAAAGAAGAAGAECPTCCVSVMQHVVL
jgi:hypothetical protein